MAYQVLRGIKVVPVDRDAPPPDLTRLGRGVVLLPKDSRPAHVIGKSPMRHGKHSPSKLRIA